MAEEVRDAGTEITEDGSLTTTVIAGIAVAVLAPQLLAGMAIGVGAMLAPKLLPTLGSALRPVIKTAVRAGYSVALKTREMAAEASEQMQDLVAEAAAEQENAGQEGSHRRATHQTSKPRRAA
jgi:Protein of unknown function (DUF5132)